MKWLWFSLFAMCVATAEITLLYWSTCAYVSVMKKLKKDKDEE